MGHTVKFVSVTNGDAGHQTHGRRRAGQAPPRRSPGIRAAAGHRRTKCWIITTASCCPRSTCASRSSAQIRQWNADIVLAPRPNDYHPDHRYTGVLVQDAAYMVVVPHRLPEVPPLRKNPVFLYYEDNFQRPNPFRPDIAVGSTTCSIRRSTRWMPTSRSSMNGCRGWTASWMKCRKIRPRAKLAEAQLDSPATRGESITGEMVRSRKGNSAQYYEAFEICEYGAQPDEARIRQLFPMLGN